MDHSRLNAILERSGVSRRALVGILHEAQEEFRYLSPETLAEVARRLGMSLSEIVSAASFYPQFRFAPAGQHRIKVCVGTACHVKGAETVWNALRDQLRIKGDDDTDPDRLFTVEKAACLGCCMLAPAVQIDSVTYGRLTARRVKLMLRDFLDRKDGAGRRFQPRPVGVPEAKARICVCSSCAAAGADKVLREVGEELERRCAPVLLEEASCSGVSYEAPLLEIEDRSGNKVRYGRLTPDAARAVIASRFSPAGPWGKLAAGGFRFIERVLLDNERPIREFLLDFASGPDAVFWGRQRRIVTEGAHDSAPLDLDAYREAGGFQALVKVRSSADKRPFIRLLEESGLRGRGGAGFPAGRKWRTVFEEQRFPKYVVCNGDEGDPGAFMDRLVIESFPFRVIEGIAIAAAVLDAAEAFAYVRAEYPLAVSRLRRAAELCRKAGLLGPDARGPGKPLELTLVTGGGAFVCGEETALLASIEGKRGVPRLRPPFPSESGLEGRPTLINNVETLAAVPWIIRHGAAAFAAIGAGPAAAGTKTFALAGKIRRGGLIEVPLGTTLREIVFEIGGGIQDDRRLKAVQIGGPSGGLIPASLIDLPVDYEALREHGAMMGSGGLVVLDETDCMVEIARYFMAFTERESCGSCAPCRVGTRRLSEILGHLTAGQGRSEDVAELERLAVTVRDLGRCGLGKSAPNPVLTSLRYFRDEFLAHAEGRCPAGMCQALVKYSINEKCIGCTRCVQVCPADAIAYTPYERHVIDSDKCTRCDACRQACPSEAVYRTGKLCGK